MRSAALSACLRILSLERGALLWVPCLLAAAALALFGIHLAPRGVSLFTRTTSLRIVVGPWNGAPGAEAERAEFVSALRRGLQRHGDLSLVDSVGVADRLRAVPDASASAPSFLAAIRALNSHVGLRGTLQRTPAGFDARLEAWDVHARARLLETHVTGTDPSVLGSALADSVQAAIFQPRRLASVMR